MRSKKRTRIILFIIIMFIILLADIGLILYLSAEYKKPAKVLEELAYTKGPRGKNTIYLEEAGELVPYLVLEHDYADSGNVILLRKYLMDEPRNWNYGTAYYKNSTLDQYLNEKYLEIVSVKPKIVNTSILITSDNMKELETINRKVFLLSMPEVGDYDKYLMLEEGKQLKYFRRKQNRIAYSEDGETKNWWLRTRDVSYGNICAFVVGKSGVCGSGDCKNNINRIRPAFCLPPDLPVTMQELDGEMVYVLESDE